MIKKLGTKIGKEFLDLKNCLKINNLVYLKLILEKDKFMHSDRLLIMSRNTALNARELSIVYENLLTNYNNHINKINSSHNEFIDKTNSQIQDLEDGITDRLNAIKAAAQSNLDDLDTRLSNGSLTRKDYSILKQKINQNTIRLQNQHIRSTNKQIKDLQKQITEKNKNLPTLRITSTHNKRQRLADLKWWGSRTITGYTKKYDRSKVNWASSPCPGFACQLIKKTVRGPVNLTGNYPTQDLSNVPPIPKFGAGILIEW